MIASDKALPASITVGLGDESSRATAPNVPEPLWSEGLTARIDSDGELPGQFLEFVSQLLTERDKVRANCAELFREWCALPNVTLPQAGWLLLQRDPWSPPASQESADAFLRNQHARILNRLECHVGRELEPIKPYLQAFAPRFRLWDVVRVAQRCFVVPNPEGELRADRWTVQPEVLEILREILEGAAAPGRIPKGQQRQMLVAERLRFHVEVVEELRRQGRAEEAQPKPKGKRDRRPLSDVPAVNVGVPGMTREEYCELFRSLHAKAGKKGLTGANEPLYDDMRALNISCGKRGRRKGVRDSAPRSRTTHRRRRQ